MKKFLPTILFTAALAAPTDAKATKPVDYTPQQLSAMCDPEADAHFSDVVDSTHAINRALAKALLKSPSRRELASVLSNELLDALYDQLDTVDADPEAVLSVLNKLQSELDDLMENTDYSDDDEVTATIKTIGEYVEGFEKLSVLLSSFANEKGNALTRRQLLDRYDASLETVDRAWRVDQGLGALKELDLPNNWDCSPIVEAYGATGQRIGLEQIEALEKSNLLTWRIPQIPVITGPESPLEFPYEQDGTTERRNRLALSEAYKAAMEVFKSAGKNLQALVEQFKRRQGIEEGFEEDPEPAVDLVWGTAAEVNKQ